MTGGRPRRPGLGVLVIATLGWMFAVWLAIALICSIATGQGDLGRTQVLARCLAGRHPSSAPGFIFGSFAGLGWR